MESDTEVVAPRRCRISLNDLAEGFEMLSADVAGFLDLEAAEVVHMSSDTLRELEQVYEALPAALANASDEQQRAALIAAIEEEGVFSADEDDILLADAIDRQLGTRYLALPEADPRAAYQDMEAFIATVADPQVQGEMDRAIRGRGAFRRFRDELSSDERQRWYAFRRERSSERAREWLAEENIELVAE
jgi:hypothetical protein